MWCDEQADTDFQKWFTQFFTNSVSLGVSAKHETASVRVRAASWYQTFPPTGCWGYHLGIFLTNPMKSLSYSHLLVLKSRWYHIISPLWLVKSNESDRLQGSKAAVAAGSLALVLGAEPKRTGDVAGEFGPVGSRFFQMFGLNIDRLKLKIAEDSWSIWFPSMSEFLLESAHLWNPFIPLMDSWATPKEAVRKVSDVQRRWELVAGSEGCH